MLGVTEKSSVTCLIHHQQAARAFLVGLEREWQVLWPMRLTPPSSLPEQAAAWDHQRGSHQRRVGATPFEALVVPPWSSGLAVINSACCLFSQYSVAVGPPPSGRCATVAQRPKFNKLA